MAGRITHMVLHFAKYTSHLFHALSDNSRSLHESALVDAFIISLSTANVLRQNFGYEFREYDKCVSSLPELAVRLEVDLSCDRADRWWCFRRFSLAMGTLAKACESLDHIEDVRFRPSFESANLEIFKTILVDAFLHDIDLHAQYYIRIADIEQSTLFAEQYPLPLPEQKDVLGG